MEKEIIRGKVIFALILVGWLICLLCGCRQVEYVPVHLETRDSIYLTKWMRDSIYFAVEKETARVSDTVYVTETRTVYKERVRTDTAYVERVDSVEVPVPVERELGRWEQTCLSYGGEAIVLSVSLVSFIVVWLLRKRRG